MLTFDPNRRKFMSDAYPKRRTEKNRAASGTLDLLILRTLVFGAEHGQGIARTIQQQSGDELLVDHGSLYPALQRLENHGWIKAEWGTSDNNRKARFYELTKAGRKQLAAETQQWRRLTAAIGRILGPEEA
jgi:transcriptional regulator